MLESRSTVTATLAQDDTTLATEDWPLMCLVLARHGPAETSRKASNQTPDSDQAETLNKCKHEQRSESMLCSPSIVNSSPGVDYEPLRPIANLAPPRRFFRTFWRSVTRRMLERQDRAKAEEIERDSKPSLA